MRKGLGTGLSILAGLFSALSGGFGQIIENPAKPIAKNAGRILDLSEVWRITDEGGEFYFRRPYNLQIAADGSFLIADNQEFLRFSSDGKFIKNLFKAGQGPGEISSGFAYSIQDRELFIQDLATRRLWRADFDGTFQDDIKLKDRNLGVFLGVAPAGFLMLKTVWPPRTEWTGKMVEVPYIVELFHKDGSKSGDIATFKTNSFFSLNRATNWDSTITVLSADKRFLFAHYGREYLVEVVDVSAGKIIRAFRRAYPRVPHVEPSWEAESRKKNGFPKIEHETDILGLHSANGHIWIETSAEDKQKGRLIDVFDRDGQFIDSFYLGAGRSLMAVREAFVLCLEKNEDETITIVKYLIGSPK
jgi:hypothetical protein